MSADDGRSGRWNGENGRSGRRDGDDQRGQPGQPRPGRHVAPSPTGRYAPPLLPRDLPREPRFLPNQEAPRANDQRRQSNQEAPRASQRDWFAPQPSRQPNYQRQPTRQPGSRDSALRLVWIYPDLLSTYGDRGNLIMLERRARLRGIPVEALELNSDQPVPTQGDIYLLGGGEDLPQILAARRLRADGGLAGAANAGAVIFAVCAGYQLVGAEFGGAQGEPVEGLGLLDIRSGRGERRGVGEIVADVDPALGVERLTGFENHQGVTNLGSGARPLAKVALGVGNGDGTEGAFGGRILGTYLHGPALARNPGLADLLLSWVVGPLPPVPEGAEFLTRQLRAERLAAVSA